MKYVYVLLIFTLGIAIGRWTAPTVPTNASPSENGSAEALAPASRNEMPPAQVPEAAKPNEASLATTKAESNPALLRTDDKARDKKMTELYSKLMEADQNNNIEEQNRIFAEMESLNPKHEKVFQAKASFLEDDDNWEGASNTYKECVEAIPTSAYCLKRLANIRTSTIDEKLKYGMQCLEVSPYSTFCLVDVAIALHAKGDFLKAKEYFEKALNLPRRVEGYNRDYILYQYGFTLESLNMHKEARSAFQAACKLNMKVACDQLKR